MKFLRCQRIHKAFGGVLALRGVELAFPPGAISAIIGPNGAGKTTLLNILTGFVRPDSGHCYLDENEITHLPPHRIARLGITRTFQELRLISQFSAMENVLLARPNQKGEHLFSLFRGHNVRVEEELNREEAIRLLRFVGLEKLAFQLAGELSYGQQKLLTLACCLSAKAEILLLDEPVTGIQPYMVSHILNLLRQLRRDGKVVVFIEHDIAAVREIADFVIVMDDGTIVANGPPNEILTLPHILEAYVA